MQTLREGFVFVFIFKVNPHLMLSRYRGALKCGVPLKKEISGGVERGFPGVVNFSTKAQID